MTQRLQNAYPAIGLEDAYDFIDTVSKKTDGSIIATREALLKRMGFPGRSGRATNAAGSLVHFKLLERVKGNYVITRLAYQLLTTERSSDDWKVAARKAATAPELYRYLYSIRDSVPHDLSNQLINRYSSRGVKRENVKRIIETYKGSMAFADIALPISFDNQTSGLTLDAPRSSNEGDRVEVEVNGQVFSILSEYFIEAYEKTQKYDLTLLEKKLQVNTPQKQLRYKAR